MDDAALGKFTVLGPSLELLGIRYANCNRQSPQRREMFKTLAEAVTTSPSQRKQ